MYLIVPAVSSESFVAELAHIKDCSKNNNLRLNCAKTKEIVFRATEKRGRTLQYKFRHRATASSEFQV